MVIALISGTTSYYHACFKLAKPEKVLLHLTKQRDELPTWYFQQVSGKALPHTQQSVDQYSSTIQEPIRNAESQARLQTAESESAL